MNGAQDLSNRSDHAIRDEHAEERSDKRAADQLAEHFRRVTDGAHGFDNAEHGRNNTQRGQGVRHCLNSCRNPMVFMMVRLDFFIHQRFHFVRCLAAEAHHAEVITNELDGMMVIVKRRKLVKEVTLIGVFDVRFERQHPLGARHLEYLILHAEQFDIVFFFIRGPLGGLAHTLA